ncbi:MAG: adenylate/guanylate cyclase domain-containing protein [Candidatus Odyssella sp.]|nr:adenylate/guanylate cyclase domain-containing protein [Candidatus Odyssella sp.]
MTAPAASRAFPLAFLFSGPAVEPRLRQAFSAAALASLRMAMRAKLAASAIVAAFLVVQFPSWPVLWWIGLAALFGAAGVLQYRLAKARPRAWRKYAFMLFDVALIAFASLLRNPLIDYGGVAVQLDLRFQSFLYLFIPLALSIFSFTPRFVLFTGACIAVVWLAAVAPIVLRPDTVTLLDLPNRGAATIAEKTEYLLKPTFVHLANLTQEVVILLVVALLLALGVSRQMGLVVRQIAAERSRAALARYFSPNMVDEIAALDRPLGEVRAQQAGVLFADIVGFTALAERLGPEKTMELLRGFHRRMAESVFAHGGTVDKYIGDAVMATFGTPRPSGDDALRAVRCALAMADAVARWNTERAAAGEAPIRIGIGLHYGPVVAGDMGDERRLEYAVIGDTVNTASRIEALTRERGVVALISADTVAAAGPQLDASAQGRLQPAAPAQLRGRAQPVELWAAA